LRTLTLSTKEKLNSTHENCFSSRHQSVGFWSYPSVQLQLFGAWNKKNLWKISASRKGRKRITFHTASLIINHRFVSNKKIHASVIVSISKVDNRHQVSERNIFVIRKWTVKLNSRFFGGVVRTTRKSREKYLSHNSLWMSIDFLLLLCAAFFFIFMTRSDTQL
jgi:hypothetical protein